MPILPDHVHISEREADGSWEDCTFDSGLEWYRLCVDARKPATHAEAEALRRASGRAMTGGTNLGDFRKGVSVRYGKTLPALVSNRTALKPGQACVRQGSMKAFGPSHRLSKWQTNFDSGHAVLEFNLGGQLYWCDPLAPKDAAVPVKVTRAEADSYAAAFPGASAIIGTITHLPVIKEPTVDLVTFLPGFTANVKPASNVRSAPRVAATKLHATTAKLPVLVIGTVKGDVDTANGSDVWYALWHENRVEYTAKDNVVDLKAPVVSTGLTQAQLDAAVAAAKSTAQAALTAAVAAAKAEAIAAERVRVRSILGV